MSLYFRSLYLLILSLMLIVFNQTIPVQAESSPSSEQPLNLQELEKTGGDINQVTGDIELFPYLIKVIFFLIIIGILIYFLIRFLSNQSRQSLGGLPLKILGGVALGQNRSLQIVQVGKRLYVLGVGQDIRLLSEIEDEQEVFEWTNREPVVNHFLSSIAKWRKKENQADSFQHVFQEQLNLLKENRHKAEDVLFQSTDIEEGKNYDR